MASDPPSKPEHPESAALRGSGPYVLRPLLQGVPLSAEGGDEEIKINCVDFLGMYQTGSSPPLLLAEGS